MSIKAINVKNILGQSILADGFDIIMDLDKSHNSWLIDKRDGTPFLDMFSMYASGCIGYNHPSILANKEQLARVALYKPTLSDIYAVEYAEFLQTFNQIGIPKYLPHAFFIEGGALAVENALKTAFDWKIRKNISKGKGEKGYKVIHFKEAFHGRSGYTLSLTNTDPVKVKYFPKFDWPRFDNPYLSFPETTRSIEQTRQQERKVLKEIKNLLDKEAADISSIIIEPIQGEGGDNHFRDEFFIGLKKLCDEYSLLLIFDEVQTGIGITGKMWAHQHFSVKPDIISFGKKTQVCGILAGQKIDEIEDNVFKKSSRLNSTFGGNLTDMIRFKTILEVIKDERLVENADKQGKYLLNKITELEKEFPAFITNGRGRGLFCAFDLPSETERNNLFKIILENKLLILPSGTKSMRFRPHLTVNQTEIDQAIHIIHKSVKALLK